MRFPGASGRLKIGMRILRLSKDYLRPIESGRTDTSLCVATTGKGYRKKILGTLSKSVGLEGPPRRLVCVFLLVIFSYFYSSSMYDLFFLCFAALDRPLLNSVWQERILRILDIEDRRYNIFIEPDLLTTFSLGLVPSSSIRALVKANKKRKLLCQSLSTGFVLFCFFCFFVFTLVCFLPVGVDTMKLNKNRLKQLAQSGEVTAAPVSLKRKKPNEGSSKRVEEAPSRPSIPTVVPSVIPIAVPFVQKAPTVVMVDSDLTPPSDSSATMINQSPHVAIDKAKGAISSRDTDEYAVAHTENLSYLMVHSLMRVWFFVLIIFHLFPLHFWLLT